MSIKYTLQTALLLLLAAVFVALSTQQIVSADANSGCTVSVRYDNAWDGGVVANVAIFNNTGSPIEDWELSMNWPDASGATVADSWVAGAVSVSGSTIKASADSGVTATIEHNDVRTFGFVVEGGQLDPFSSKPTNITVNGLNCDPLNSQAFPGQNFGGTQPILNDPEGQWGLEAARANAEGNECLTRFLEIYQAVHDESNGYFDEEGIPYHTVEELNVEAPDFGHVTTSEAFSYMMLMEAAYGKVSGDWSNFEKAFAIIEHTIIPDAHQQPTWNNHQTNMEGGSGVATFAPEYHDGANNYPSILNDANADGTTDDPSWKGLVPTGTDPIYGGLQEHWNGGATNSGPIYTMHWLLDVDNAYQFGEGERGNANSVYINTFQRGAQESTWETLPHPSYELDDGDVMNEFVQDGDGNDNIAQWRYTNAPDADGRVAEAARMAELWSQEVGGYDQVAPVISKAAKMLDYLRYDMFDKYFKPIGCESAKDIRDCNTGPGDGTYEGAHDLYAWYSSWGAPLDGEWSFLIGSSDIHFGYQEPWAAYVVSNDSLNANWLNPGDGLKGLSPEGVTQYKNSFQRQMELYAWLQSDANGTDQDGNVVPAGAFAGGVTNSVDGQYANSTYSGNRFYGMAYDDNPVYHDPGSNTWFGFQVWSGQRYMATMVEMANAGDTSGDFPVWLDVANDWVAMALGTIKFDYNGEAFALPVAIDWGDPAASQSGVNYNGGNAAQLKDANKNLRMDIKAYNQGVGVGAAMARTLLAYSQIDGAEFAQEAGDTALKLMDALWNYKFSTDDYGVVGFTTPEYRGDYLRFWNETWINDQYTTGNGDTLGTGATFDEIHWFYADACEGITELDPSNPEHRMCNQYCEVHDSWSDVNGDGSAAERAAKMVYHRFWAQADNATALVEADDWGFDCGDMPTMVTTENPDAAPAGATNLIENPSYTAAPAACASYVQPADPEPIDPVDAVEPTPTPAPTKPAATPVANGGVTVNCDYRWNLIDAVLIKQYDVLLIPGRNTCTPSNPATAANNQQVYLPECDINGDGVCGLVDAVIIQQCDAGVVNPFCASEINPVNNAPLP